MEGYLRASERSRERPWNAPTTLSVACVTGSSKLPPAGETVPPMEKNPVQMMDQPYLHRQMKWRYPYATALDQRSIPYATQNFEPGLFIVYQQADGTVSAYLESAERGSISKRGTPPAT